MKFVLSFASTEKYAIVNKFEFQNNTKSLKVDSFYNCTKPTVVNQILNGLQKMLKSYSFFCQQII